MQVEISSGPAFALGEITLPAGGAVRVEGGATATFGGESPFVDESTLPPPAPRS